MGVAQSAGGRRTPPRALLVQPSVASARPPTQTRVRAALVSTATQTEAQTALESEREALRAEADRLRGVSARLKEASARVRVQLDEANKLEAAARDKLASALETEQRALALQRAAAAESSASALVVPTLSLPSVLADSGAHRRRSASACADMLQRAAGGGSTSPRTTDAAVVTPRSARSSASALSRTSSYTDMFSVSRYRIRKREALDEQLAADHAKLPPSSALARPLTRTLATRSLLPPPSSSAAGERRALADRNARPVGTPSAKRADAAQRARALAQ